MHVEDDVLVVGGVAEAGQGGVGGGGAIQLEAPQSGFQIAGISEGEGLGDLDDQAAFDELQAVRAILGVFPGVGGIVGGVGGVGGDFAEDLDARLGAVADDAEEGEADTQGDAEGEGVEDGGEED